MKPTYAEAGAFRGPNLLGWAVVAVLAFALAALVAKCVDSVQDWQNQAQRPDKAREEMGSP